MRKHFRQAMVTGLTLALGLTMTVTMGAQTAGPQAYTEKVLYGFPGVVRDGIFPEAGVTPDSAGNLYSTTFYGGVGGGTLGCGTVFKVDKTGKASVVYEFTGGNEDGCGPQAGLVIDSAGNLYGATTSGGDSLFPAGMVFKISGGQETVLYVFNTGNGDGQGPTSTLTRDKEDNLYGTTSYGNGFGGSVFKINAAGTYSVLYKFTNPADGSNPNRSRMLIDGDGNLYGLTNYGGDLQCNAPNGCGVLFKLGPSGKLTVLYAFQGGTDGSLPIGDLVRDKAGNFYGVTNQGGANGNGIVFRLSPQGQETILYTFGAGFDGEPLSGVVLDASGNIYGTTTFGGVDNRGSVFELTPAGVRTDLYSFSGGADGGRPYGTLLLDSSGTLYGTTVDGGISSAGTVFELSPAAR
jgi:uncharacterized repeat protein (TIGR03803 family)